MACSYCGYAYYSYCGWNYFSHCGFYYHTFLTLPQVQQVCPLSGRRSGHEAGDDRGDRPRHPPFILPEDVLVFPIAQVHRRAALLSADLERPERSAMPLFDAET